MLLLFSLRVTPIRSDSRQPQLSFYQNGARAMVTPADPPIYWESQIRQVTSVTLDFLDESQGTINDGYFAANVTGDTLGVAPAAWHSHGCNFSFAHEHAEQ